MGGVGYRLLSEALIISTAFAATAVLTFVLVSRATGRVGLAVAAAVLEVAIAPRTYSYPKVIVYAAGILLLWRYVDQPSNRRAVELGVATALAFYLRHDHGLYLGLVVLAVMAMRHGRSLRSAVQQTGVFATVCVLLVAPFFAYVEAYGSVRDYVQDLRQFSAREHSSNPFEWPSWPLPSAASVARWTSGRTGLFRSTFGGIRPRPMTVAARPRPATVFRSLKRVPSSLAGSRCMT